MVILSREVLTALVWVSAALATPVVTDFASTRDLAIRHSSLEVRQLESPCPPSYTSINGMRFKTYCKTNNAGNDAYPRFTTDKMEHCMNHCSRYWGDGEGCFGVVWRESDKQCWLRTSNTSEAGIVDREGIHSALVFEEDMRPLASECPGETGSTHDFKDGIGYTLHCNKIIGGYDTCWGGYSDCKRSPFIGYYHATSIEQCLDYCVKEHPLCRAVVYNPTLEIGFANCWPKTGFPDGNLDTPQSSHGTVHVATITSMDRIDTKCPETGTYNTQDHAWDINCGKFNAGTNITATHTQNITACIDACASNTNGCVGVVFDSTLQFGYSNCMLQNTTSVITDAAHATYAALAGTPLPSSSPSASPNPGTGSPSENETENPGGQNGNNNNDDSSKAWIAGPVVGGVLAIAIIGVGVFLWRRRKAKARAAYANQPPIAEKDAMPPAPAYTPYSGDQYSYREAPPTELGGDHAIEMAAAEPSKKFAYSNERPAHGAQELP